jgi:hypothetical protein
MPASGIPLGDILADSGYAHHDAAVWAVPLRQAGAQLVQDLHPTDRGRRARILGLPPRTRRRRRTTPLATQARHRDVAGKPCTLYWPTRTQASQVS